MLLRVENIKKDFTSGNSVQEVIKNVNLQADVGETISIVGASGSGKTTLLSIIGTTLKPTNGKVFIEEEDITKLSETELSERIRGKKVGFIFQHGYLINELSVIENVLMPMIRFNNTKKKDFTEKAVHILSTVGLKEKINRYPFELSRGEYQRVAIARAILLEPKIILADEPTGNLDSKTAEDVIGELLKHCTNGNSCLIIATHNNTISNHMNKIFRIINGQLLREK